MSSKSFDRPVKFCTASYDHYIKFWDMNGSVDSHRSIQNSDSQINSMDISKDGSLLAVGGYQYIKIYDINSMNNNPIINYEMQKNVTNVGFFKNTQQLYSGGEDCKARIYDLRMRNGVATKCLQVSNQVNSVALHPNQTELIVADESGCINIWDLKSDKTEQLIPEPGVSITCVDIDSDASYLAAVNVTGTCFLWSVSQYNNPEGVMTVNPRAKLKAHSMYTLKCRFSPDSTLLATTSADGTVKMWRTSQFDLAYTLTIPRANPHETSNAWMWDCRFSSDSDYLITVSSDHLARIWNIAEGTVEKTFTGHSKAVTCLALEEVQPMC